MDATYLFHDVSINSCVSQAFLLCQYIMTREKCGGLHITLHKLQLTTKSYSSPKGLKLSNYQLHKLNQFFFVKNVLHPIYQLNKRVRHSQHFVHDFLASSCSSLSVQEFASQATQMIIEVNSHSTIIVKFQHVDTDSHNFLNL